MVEDFIKEQNYEGLNSYIIVIYFHCSIIFLSKKKLITIN
jgi:hypothetical protein